MKAAIYYPSIYCPRKVGEVYKKECYKCPYREFESLDLCWRV